MKEQQKHRTINFLEMCSPGSPLVCKSFPHPTGVFCRLLTRASQAPYNEKVCCSYLVLQIMHEFPVYSQTCTLTSPEPVRTFVSSPENVFSRLVPFRKTSPEAETRVYIVEMRNLLRNQSGKVLSSPETVRNLPGTIPEPVRHQS